MQERVLQVRRGLHRVRVLIGLGSGQPVYFFVPYSYQAAPYTSAEFTGA